ncbi:hypothetical protein AVEN_232891-1 [Araneus ventricosus]|uniref:Uncharacterized protein n=1 Tax=Araneus ventricosus TaxID=182803 RepID=A0A4Y2TPC8_ARAVE|nr:hypothetical protein AVEN_232891-1 [Araneus ventricosus]
MGQVVTEEYLVDSKCDGLRLKLGIITLPPLQITTSPEHILKKKKKKNFLLRRSFPPVLVPKRRRGLGVLGNRDIGGPPDRNLTDRLSNWCSLVAGGQQLPADVFRFQAATASEHMIRSIANVRKAEGVYRDEEQNDF